MTRPSPRAGAHKAVTAIRAASAIGASDAPAFERGTILDDGRLLPDTWTGEPFWPSGSQDQDDMGFDMAWHLAPLQVGEPGLVGVTDTGTGSSGASLEHTHPTRALTPGDRVLLVWARGVPIVLEILA